MYSDYIRNISVANEEIVKNSRAIYILNGFWLLFQSRSVIKKLLLLYEK